jgi:hypothetical protein
MEERKSVPVGSSVGHNKPPVRIGSQTQPSESIGDKNRINNMCLKRAVLSIKLKFYCANLLSSITLEDRVVKSCMNDK